MSVAGAYDIAVQTPLGQQRGRLTVAPDGSGFTGSLSGDLGSELIAGTVEGDTIAWTMEVRQPMPLKLDCRATVAGDTITGEVRAGFLGSFPLTGDRAPA